jgi:1-deoxy-D-xylulose-5-phosphate reductoisomerase
VAVAAFLSGRIGWLDIASVVKETLERHEESKLAEVEDVIAADSDARAVASAVIDQMGAGE